MYNVRKAMEKRGFKKKSEYCGKALEKAKK